MKERGLALPRHRHGQLRRRTLRGSGWPRADRLVRFETNGTISSGEATFNSDLNNTLNLNVPFLKRSRLESLEGFTHGLRKRGTLKQPELERLLQRWNGELDDGPLEPFCQVVVYWLRKRLARENRSLSR